MDFSDDRDFDCSFDHQDRNDEFAGELLEKRIDSLVWKTTLLAVVLTCLIAVAAGLAYYRLSSKMADFQHTGSSAVQEVSRAFEEKLTALQEHSSAQDKALAEIRGKLTAVDRNAGAIKNIQSSFKDLQVSVTAHQDGLKSLQDDIKSLSATDGKTAASLTGLRQDLEKLLVTVAETSRQQLALRQQIEGLDLRLKGLAAEKVDGGTLDQGLADLDKRWQTGLTASTGALEKDLKRLESQIGEVRRQLSVLSRPTPPAAGPTSPLPAAPGIREENL